MVYSFRGLNVWTLGPVPLDLRWGNVYLCLYCLESEVRLRVMVGSHGRTKLPPQGSQEGAPPFTSQLPLPHFMQLDPDFL